MYVYIYNLGVKDFRNIVTGIFSADKSHLKMYMSSSNILPPTIKTTI